MYRHQPAGPGHRDLEGEQEKMRKLRRLGVAGGAALLAAALIAPAGVAHADTTTVTDQYGAAASSQVVDMDILGRHVSFGTADVTSTLDAVTKQVSAEAKGLGTLLVPASQAVARFNDRATFVVTIWGGTHNHRQKDSRTQLQRLGCRRYAQAASLFSSGSLTSMPLSMRRFQRRPPMRIAAVTRLRSSGWLASMSSSAPACSGGRD